MGVGSRDRLGLVSRASCFHLDGLFIGWLGLDNSVHSSLNIPKTTIGQCWLLLSHRTSKFFLGKTKIKIAENFFRTGVPKMSL